MQVLIHVTAVDGEPGAHDLFQWLSSDVATRAVDLGLVDAGSVPDSLGALDAVQAVLSDATSIGSLAVAIATWMGSRGRGARVDVENRGQRFSIEDLDDHSIQELVERLRASEEQRSTTAEGPGSDE